MTSSSYPDIWGTPDWLKTYIHEKYNTNRLFDPAPFPRPIERDPLDGSFKEFNGLQVEWARRTFVNPPFSKIIHWVKKMYEEYLKGKFIVMLMPTGKTNTLYFHEYVLPYAKFEFLKGRIRFVDLLKQKPYAEASSFATMLVIMDPQGSRGIEYPKILIEEDEPAPGGPPKKKQKLSNTQCGHSPPGKEGLIMWKFHDKISLNF